METIECELRSFVTDEEYARLFSRLQAEGEYKGKDEQVTYYFSGDADLRIQQNTHGAKIWLKKGKLHDDQREEIEIPVKRGDFPFLERLFLALGYTVTIKWFRIRHTFTWNGVTATLDDTKGYGKIMELEILASGTEKDAALARLTDLFKTLGIAMTPKEVFAERFAHYKAHWQELTQ